MSCPANYVISMVPIEIISPSPKNDEIYGEFQHEAQYEHVTRSTKSEADEVATAIQTLHQTGTPAVEIAASLHVAHPGVRYVICHGHYPVRQLDPCWSGAGQ
jgi:hypothetical protein